MSLVLLLFGDALAGWTEALAVATFVLALATLAGLVVAWILASRDRAAAKALLSEQKKNDDERSSEEIAAAREDAGRQIAEMRAQLEGADARSSKEIVAARELAEHQIATAKAESDRQIAEMRAQLDAASRPLLIEVQPSGPMYPDMGARPNPDIKPGNSRQVDETIRVQFGAAAVEIDPRALYVELAGGFVRLNLPVRNVGNGLALIHARGVEVQGEGLGDVEFRVVQRERVPVGETARVG
jgi:hypothetical protein